MFYRNIITDEIRSEEDARTDIKEMIIDGDYEDKLAETTAEWLGVGGDEKDLLTLYHNWLDPEACGQIFNMLAEQLFDEIYEPIQGVISNPDNMSMKAALSVIVNDCLDSENDLVRIAAKKVLKGMDLIKQMGKEMGKNI